MTDPTPPTSDSSKQMADELTTIDFLGAYERAKTFEERHQVRISIDEWIAGKIQASQAALEKAYGGCHNCYGKGYATTADGVIGYEDFGGEGFKSPITVKMKFCKCDRGAALKTLMQQKGIK